MSIGHDIAQRLVDAWLDKPGDGEWLRLRPIRERVGFGLTQSDITRLVDAIDQAITLAIGLALKEKEL